MKVLFVASNPEDSASLNLESEITELQRRFIEAEGEPVKFIFQPRICLEDLPRLLIYHKPDVLHLSAHGNEQDLVMTRGDGTKVKLEATALLTFMRGARPKVVLLNACNSQSMAEELAAEVDVAIGSTAAITNLAARAAAVAFYERMLKGLPLEDAFDVARSLAVTLQDKTVDLRLFAKPGIDCKTVTLHRVPRLIAHFEPFKPRARQQAFEVYFGVAGIPSTTTQLLIFTDDRDYAANDDYLEQLCSLTHRPPTRGIVWSDDLWPIEGDMRMFATGVTSDGTTFSVASTVTDALETAYTHHASEPPPEIVLDAIERLRLQDGSKIVFRKSGH